MPTILTAGDAVSAASSLAAGNDGLLNLVVGPAGSKVTAIALAADGTPTFIKQPVLSFATYHLVLNTTNGHGSTNPMIRRWLNTTLSQGAGLTYADSATLGGSFTCDVAGTYSFAYYDLFSGGAAFGLSLNSTQLTTSFLGISINTRRSFGYTPSADIVGYGGAVITLAVNDVVRGHTTGAGNGAPERGLMIITRIS